MATLCQVAKLAVNRPFVPPGAGRVFAPHFPVESRNNLAPFSGPPSSEPRAVLPAAAASQLLAPTKGAEIGRIASKYVRVSLPAPPPTSPPHSPALTADKAEVAAEQARPPRLERSTPSPHLTTPHQQSRNWFATEPVSDDVDGSRESRESRIATTKAANMNHHHHTQQQQKAGEQQLSEPEDMEMEG